MSSDQKAKAPTDRPPIESLTSLLSHSERVKAAVAECAEELSSVNSGIQRELALRAPLPGIETALKKSVAVEDKVQEASADLSVVNRALENEVSERHILEHRLAVVTESADSARHASLHDGLTGLANRALFTDRLEHGLAQAVRHGRTLAVMFLDLDEFKAINDTHGHEAGDHVMKMVAERLTKNTRSADTVSRHGGDEFLYLLMEIQDERALVAIAQKLIDVIEAPFDIDVRERTVRLTVKVSIGIAVYPTDGTTSDGLIAAADKAMYRAKQTHSRYGFAR